jgi:hypothetical protein
MALTDLAGPLTVKVPVAEGTGAADKCLHRAGPMSVLNPTVPSATMKEVLLLYCKNSKPKDQFALRTRNKKYGARNEPSSRRETLYAV